MLGHGFKGQIRPAFQHGQIFCVAAVARKQRRLRADALRSGSYEQQDEIFQRFVERYPNLKCIARHVRYAHSGSENSLKAFMWYEGHTFESKLFTFTILDRVGGGDAFASGLIYAMLHDYKPMDMLNFAVASSVIKHTIHGDANITDDVSSIRNLMNMNYDIRR